MRPEGPLARDEDLVGQGRYGAVLQTAHLGSLDSPEARALVADFLTAPNGSVGGPGA